MRVQDITIDPVANFLIAIMPLGFVFDRILAFGFGICWTQIYTGPIVAAYIILTNYFFVRSYKILIAFISLIAGSLSTFAFVEISYPECHPLAYGSNTITQVATICSGILAFVIVCCVHIYNNRKLSKSLKDGP